jgi:hypothetical protein
MTAGLERALATRRAMAIAVFLAMAVASTSSAVGFLTDDHGFRAALHSTNERAPAAYDLFRFVPGDAADNQLRIRYGVLPWWAAPALRIHFLRPLTSLVFAATDRAFGDAPLAGHLVSLAWYLAMLLAAAVVFRRLLQPAAATLALAVFGLSAAHLDGYAWISARHVVIAGALAAGTLAARGSRHRWLAPVMFVAALTGSEAALAVAPLWVALELSATARAWRARWRGCLPVIAISLGYLTVYAALGGGTRASGGYHDPMTDPLGFALLAAVRVPVLLGDAALGIPAELAHVVAEWRLALVGLAAVGILALAWRWTASSTASAASTVTRDDAGSAGPPGTAPVAADDAAAPDGAEQRRTIAWLALAGVGATVLGATGFPSGRVLVIPNLAFAPLIGLVLYRGLAAHWPGRAMAVVLAIIHLVVAPAATLRGVAKLTHRARVTEAIAAHIAELAPSSGRVVIVAASDPMVYVYPRSILADVAPGTVRCWSVWSAAHASHRVTRTGARTLVVEPIERPMLDGSFDELYRAPGLPFAAGDTVQQCGATIRVAAVRDGRPARLEIELRRSLDDPEILLLAWRAHRLVRFTPPRVGETVELAWSAGPSGVL